MHLFSDYRNWFRDAPNIRQWVQAYLPSRVKELDAHEFFQSVLNDEVPWLVDFFAPWCGHCTMFAPEFELVAKHFEGRVKLGKINCDANFQACQAAGVRAYPSVRLYLGVGDDELTQNAAGIEIQSQDHRMIIQVVENQVKTVVNDKANHDEL